MTTCKGIQIARHLDAGYKPVIDYGAWRVAVLNGSANERIGSLQKHDETDEVFVLLHGDCTLVLCEDEGEPEHLYAVRMLPDTVYNIKKGIWHNHVLTPGTSVLIVENVDTSLSNSPIHRLAAAVDVQTLPTPLAEDA